MIIGTIPFWRGGALSFYRNKHFFYHVKETGMKKAVFYN